MIKKIVLFITILFALFHPVSALAHQPVIVGNQTIRITDPEISRAFYDELDLAPQQYFIESSKEFNLYLNLLVPLKVNTNGRYSAKIYNLNNNQKLIATLEGTSVPWSIYYETFAKDYYYKGPEFDQILPAGSYRVDVYSGDNQGKYILAIGKIENFTFQNSYNIIGILQNLKVNFFNTSPFTLIITIFGAVYFSIILLIAIIVWLIYRKIPLKTKRIIKPSKKRKIILIFISLILLSVSLYFWNPIVMFLSDFFILLAVFN